MDLSESCDSIDKSFIIDDFEVGRLWRVYLYRVCVSLYAKRHYRHKQYFVAVVSIDSNRSIMSNQVRKKMVVVWIEIERVSSKPIETDRDSSQTKRLISKNIFIYTINQFQSNCWQCTDWKYGIFPHVVLFRCEASFAIPIQFDRFITITWHMNKRMDWRTRLIIRWLNRFNISHICTTHVFCARINSEDSWLLPPSHSIFVY